MRWLALIPARAGSKRCPGKNIAELGDKPLLAWTIEAAKASGIFGDNIVVSSESQLTREIARLWGACGLERPESLSRDDTPSLSVVDFHLRDWRNVDAVMLLQPTSPFRSALDIQSAAALLESTGGDSVVSVINAPRDLVFSMGHANRLRQYTAPFVQCNGAIYALTVSAMKHGEDWYSGVAYAYEMPKDRSLDIDTPFDLEIARMMVAKRAA